MAELPVTLNLKNVPLSDVLKYVTQIAGLKYRVEASVPDFLVDTTVSAGAEGAFWKVVRSRHEEFPDIMVEKRQGLLVVFFQPAEGAIS